LSSVLADHQLKAGRCRYGAREDETALELIAAGGFDPSVVTDRVLPFTAAETALLEPHTKLVFTRET
jgi:hypothetical protein